MRPRVLRSALFLLAIAAPPGLRAQQRAQTPAGFDRAWAGMRASFDSSLRNANIAGGSLWFVHNDQVLGRANFGLANREPSRAVTDSTIYHWASITKTLTAIAIMQLRDRGQLSLDDPVVKYVPELREVHDTFGDIAEITIRQFMTHSAGFRAGTWPWSGDKSWYPFEPPRWEQLAAMMPYTEILFKPGSRFSYSNPGIIYLGRVIERLSGEDYEVYVDKNILKPLGMYHSYFDATPFNLLKDRSNGYEVAGGQASAIGLSFDTGITVSNSGLNAPLGDMCRYLAFLVGAPAHAEEYDRLLKRSSLEEMWRPVLPVVGGNTEGDSVSAGFFTLDTGGRRYVGKTGSQAGFRSFFYFDPMARTAAIGVTNTSGSGRAGSGPDADAAWLLLDVRNQLMHRIFPLFH